LNTPYLTTYLEQLRLHSAISAYISNFCYFLRWRRSLRQKGSPLADEYPWITFAAANYLEKYLKSNHRIFEFGSGGSTLFFLSRCQFLSTVEHDVEWFSIVKKCVENKSYFNWSGVLAPPETGDIAASPDSANPAHYASRHVSHVNFKQYAHTIDQYPDEFFDIVMVDGRSRPACIKQSVAKIRMGGLIVLDNAERSYYLGSAVQKCLHDFVLVLDHRSASPYTWQFTQTNIWRKSATK